MGTATPYTHDVFMVHVRRTRVVGSVLCVALLGLVSRGSGPSLISSARAASNQLCPTLHPVETTPENHWIRHVAVARETVDQIAHRYRVRPDRLRAWNALTDEANELKAGVELRVWTTRKPSPRQRIDYIVQEGDTWWRIAAGHGVDSWQLRSYNWPYQDKMVPGEKLKIWIDPLVYDWIHADAVVIPPEGSRVVRRGGVGVGSPDDGWLVNAVKIPPGEGYQVRFPETSYGTTHAVEQLLAGINRFRERSHNHGTLKIGSMSAVRGGELGHHRSHQTGRDVDIRLPRRAEIPSAIALTPKRVDWLATWELIKAFAEVDSVVVFLDYAMQRRVHAAATAAGATDAELDALLQYPRGSHARVGFVRHSPGHDQHVHVRFDCGPCELECHSIDDVEAEEDIGLTDQGARAMSTPPEYAPPEWGLVHGRG